MSHQPEENRANNGLGLECKWIKRLYGHDGELKQEAVNYNMITSAGVSALVLLLSEMVTSNSANTFKYIGVGTDTTSEQTSNTVLGAELSRHTCTVSYSAGAVLEVVGTFAAGSGTGAIAEYAIFDSNTNGSMLNGDTENVINKGASDSLQVTAQITFQPG